MLEFSDIQFQVSILTLVRVVKDKMKKFGRCGCYKVKDQLGKSGTDGLMMNLKHPVVWYNGGLAQLMN